MAGFSVEVNRSDLAEVERTLTGVKNGYSKVVSRSLNRTITGVRTDSVKEIQNVITPKATVIRKTFKMVKATKVSLIAAVKSSGGPLPLIHYKARQTKRGVTVQVKKKSSRALFPGAFIATMPKSKHVGVFQREYKDKRLPAKKARTGLAYGALPKKYRLPIKQLYGPRVPDIMENTDVMKPILKKAGDRLQKELNSQLNFEMSKL